MTTEVAEVTVQFVNPPKEGKKRGSIKTAEGISFWGPMTLLRQFSPGEVCKIEFSTSEDGQWKSIIKKIGGKPAPAQLALPPRQRTNPQDQKNIFVTALLGHFIDAGKVGLDEEMIATAADLILRAYRRSEIGGSNQQVREDLNDEVPW